VEDLGVDGRILLNSIRKNSDLMDVNWTCLPKNRDKWRAVVIAIMKLRPSGNAEILSLAEGLLASEDST
jgi:hypothetical protein